MDPLSITVSALTLLQMTAQAIKLGNLYVRGVKSVPKELPALVSELKLLEHNIQALTDHLQAVSTSDGGVADNLVKRLQEPMDSCRQELVTLDKVLEKQMGKGKGFLRKLGLQLKWPLKSQETMDIIQRLKRYENSFVLALGVDTSSMTHTIQKDTITIRQDVAAMKSAQQQSAEEKKRAQREQKFRDVVAWLSPTGVDPFVNYNAALKLKEPGTGKWLTASESFKDWRDERHSFLWLYGAAGCGKTILSSHILETLNKEATDPRKKPVFFFCDFREEKKTKSINICRSLAAQILSSHFTELPKELEEWYEKRTLIGAFEDRQVQEILQLLASGAGDLMVLVDALDECKDRIEFLRVMKTVQKVGNINFIFTSREELDVKTEVGDQPKLHITPDAVDGDIKLFISEEIVRHPRLRKLKPDLKKDIEKTVTNGANGMFRWAACQLDSIASKRLDRDIRAALTQLPANLEETYIRILADIGNDDRDIAIRVLNWLVCSFRPMLICEVVDAVAIELDTGNIDLEYKLEHPEDLLEICRSLIILDVNTQSISLAHFSVKEFLMKKRNIQEFFYVPQERNYDLVKYCMTYMSFDDFKPGPSLHYEEQIKQYPFYEYAAEFWMKHAYGHTDVNDTRFLRHLESFLSPSTPDSPVTGPFSSWVQCYLRILDKSRPEQTKSPRQSNFYYPCRFGLESTVAMLLSKGHDPKGTDGGHLIAAAQSGNVGVVKHLVDAGAEINHVTQSNDTAICAAIRSNNIAALNFLLSHGGDILLGSPSPLITAISSRSPEAVEICLRAGADVRENVGRDELNTPFIQAALTAGQAGRDIYALLVEHGAAVIHLQAMGMELPENRDPVNIGALADKNCITAAQKILKADIEKGFKIADGFLEYLCIKNAVHVCIQNGHARYLKMLLLHLGPRFADYDRVFEMATLRGKARLVKAVLEGWKKAGMNQKMGDSLLIATVLGDASKAKLLLENGASPKQVAENGWSPIRYAVVNKREEITELFKQHGAQLSREAALREVDRVPEKWVASVPWLPKEGDDIRGDRLPQGLTLDGGIAQIAAGTPGSGAFIHTDAPVTAAIGLYSFSITVKSAPRAIHFGLASHLPVYDPDSTIIFAPGRNGAARTIAYCSDGSLSTFGERLAHFGPTYTTGDTVTCTWDIDSQLAWFSVNGQKAGKAVTGVKGLLMPIVHLTPEAEVSAEFGGTVSGCSVDLDRGMQQDGGVSFTGKVGWDPEKLDRWLDRMLGDVEDDEDDI